MTPPNSGERVATVSLPRSGGDRATAPGGASRRRGAGAVATALSSPDVRASARRPPCALRAPPGAPPTCRSPDPARSRAVHDDVPPALLERRRSREATFCDLTSRDEMRKAALPEGGSMRPLVAVLVVSLFVAAVRAQTNDHLKCYKVHDAERLVGSVDL